MTKKHKNEYNEDYNKSFKEVFYIGILDNNNTVKYTHKYEKIRDLRQYLASLLEENQECLQKARKLIKSKEIKDTSKIFLLECQDTRILIAMRLDVMIKPFEDMKKIEISKLERVE